MGGTLVGTPPDAGGDGGAWQYFRGADALRALAASRRRGVRERALQSALLTASAASRRRSRDARRGGARLGRRRAAAAVGLGGVHRRWRRAAAPAAVNGGA